MNFHRSRMMFFCLFHYASEKYQDFSSKFCLKSLKATVWSNFITGQFWVLTSILTMHSLEIRHYQRFNEEWNNSGKNFSKYTIYDILVNRCHYPVCRPKKPLISNRVLQLHNTAFSKFAIYMAFLNAKSTFLFMSNRSIL